MVRRRASRRANPNGLRPSPALCNTELRNYTGCWKTIAIPSVGHLQACQHSQKHRFARAIGADDYGNTLRIYIQIDSGENRTSAGSELDAREVYRKHQRLSGEVGHIH
jgi:hypothetical protein